MPCWMYWQVHTFTIHKTTWSVCPCFCLIAFPCTWLFGPYTPQQTVSAGFAYRHIGHNALNNSLMIRLGSQIFCLPIPVRKAGIMFMYSKFPQPSIIHCTHVHVPVWYPKTWIQTRGMKIYLWTFEGGTRQYNFLTRRANKDSEQRRTNWRVLIVLFW